jgi:hypothetical protein
MKTVLTVSLFAMAVFALTSCAPPANTNTNTNGNTNANLAAKPAAPTADSLMALETKAWEAFKNKDGKYFETFLADAPMISGNGGPAMSKAEVVKMISEHKEDVKSFSLSSPHVTPVGADAVVLTYKATVEGTENGKPLPSPVTAATLFVRAGNDWKAYYHNEVKVIDMAQPAADGAKKDAAPAANADKADSGSSSTKPAAAPNTNSAASNTAAGSNSASSNTNSSASAGDAALTDALMAVERKGWDGWKAKDAKVLDEITATNFAFVDPTGHARLSKADALKAWTTDNPCNVSSVTLSDAKSQSISKDVAILVVKGNAVGTCGDMKLEPLWNTTIFVKEGDVWKTAYIFETPITRS